MAEEARWQPAYVPRPGSVRAAHLGTRDDHSWWDTRMRCWRNSAGDIIRTSNIRTADAESRRSGQRAMIADRNDYRICGCKAHMNHRLGCPMDTPSRSPHQGLSPWKEGHCDGTGGPANGPQDVIHYNNEEALAIEHAWIALPDAHRLKQRYALVRGQQQLPSAADRTRSNPRGRGRGRGAAQGEGRDRESARQRAASGAASGARQRAERAEAETQTTPRHLYQANLFRLRPCRLRCPRGNSHALKTAHHRRVESYTSGKRPSCQEGPHPPA